MALAVDRPVGEVVNGRAKNGLVAPAVPGLPSDIMQSRKKVFEFAFVRALGSADCFAHHAVQTIQLVEQAPEKTK